MQQGSGEFIKSRRISFTSIVITFSLVLIVFQSYSQATIDGRVTEQDFGEPLVKSIVQVQGSNFYTVTNRFGYFKMELPEAFFQLEAIHPIVYSEFYNTTTYDDIYTPIGAIRMEAKAVGRLEQRYLASRINPIFHPAAVNTTPTLDVMYQSGSSDFNELFESQPSAYLIENGGAYNSSEIRVRGFAANQNQVVFNGIALNNPETGRMNTPLYSGMSDWGQDVQFTTGITSGKQSELGQSSLINVLPFMPNKDFGVKVTASAGTNSYLKTAATVHSGLSRKKVAFSLMIDRTAGDGIPDYTGFQSYGAYLNVYKELNHNHSFFLTSVAKSWQSDQRTRPDSISRIATFGINHNNDWGLQDNAETGWNKSFGISNLNVLTHYWHLRVNSRLVSQLYLELENSARSYPIGEIDGYSPYELAATDRGLVNFDTIAYSNAGNTVSAADGIVTLAAVSKATRFGLQTQYIHEIDKLTTISLAADAEQYAADHFGSLNDLIGADGFTDQSNLNAEAQTITSVLSSSFFPKSGKADKVDHYYRSLIRKMGISMKLEKMGNRSYAYGEMGVYAKSLKREDYFAYLSTSSEHKTDWVNQLGWRAAAGLTYRLNEAHSVRFNSGANSAPTRFNVVFPATNNWENTAAKNTNQYTGELAYVLSKAKVFASLRGFVTYQQNRSDIQTYGLDDGEQFAVISGIDQFHRGLELSGQVTYFKRFNFYLNASYGKWTYSNDPFAEVYDSSNELVSSSKLPFKDYNTDNCPPVSLYLKNEFNLFKGLELNLNYYRSFRSYAPMMVHDFDADLAPEQLKLPAFDRLGAGLNYYLELRDKKTLNVFADVRNLLGSEYINQIYTNDTDTSYSNNLAHFGKGTSWRVGASFCF